MKYDSISGLFTAIADEIRAKDGSSELINPQDLPERVKNLSGIPDVPTLECWKVTLPSDDTDAIYGFMNTIDYFGDHFIVVSEIDGILYGGLGPMIGSGGGYDSYAANIFYIGMLINGSAHFIHNYLDGFREYELEPFGKRITLSDFLSIISGASDFQI